MIDNLIQEIRAFAARPDVRIVMLAREAGVHPNSLYGLSKKDWNPNANTLRALEQTVRRLSDVVVNVDPPRAAE